MPELNIPERYQAGVSKIRKLDDRTVRDIRKALDSVVTSQEASDISPMQRPDSVAISAVTSVSQTNLEDFKQIAESLNALYGVRAARDVPVEIFVEEVSDALERLDSPDLKLPHSERSSFQEKLSILLNAEVFGIISKAYDLRTDDERVFCHARILTDLRPIFGQVIEDGPRGMVVVHLLKLGFHRGNERHQEFYVSLDGDDLKTLRGVIDRAEAKAKTLKSSIGDVRLFGAPKE